MTATAYASLVSLLNTLDLIHNHPRLSTSLDNFQNESLRQMVDFFVDFVEKYSDAESREAEDLVRRIADVAREAEDLIEVHAADRIRDGSTTESLTLLQRTIEEMNFLKEKVSKLKEGTGFITQSSNMPPPPSSSDPPANAKTTTMVGFDGYVEQLLDQLTGHHSDRQIIPIVGMGGIGKTTLARNVYENLLTLHHFDVRAWVVVSQEFDASEVLSQALSCLGRSTSKMDRETDDQLGEELYKILYGRRYLIMLDDMWSVEAWEKIMVFFPKSNNGSRIVVTTRQQELVDYFDSSALAVGFLDDKNSWELFCQKTFAQQGCPHPELEQVGERIVKKCGGLPLAIVVIGGLLGKSSRMLEYWEKIAENISLILKSGEGNKVMSILYLSYKHLPVCLKPCLLHLGLFPEDHEIYEDELIKLWVAEGFIKPNRYQSLEDVAESYIKNLVDRNLLLVRGSKLKTVGICSVHDLVRESCIRISKKEKYYCVQRDRDGRRHSIVQTTKNSLYSLYSSYSSKRSSSIVRPLILEGEGERAATPFKSRLWRVLFSDGENKHLHCNFQEVNLRFLFHQGHGMVNTYRLPSSISLLWSLQTLIVQACDAVVAPSEIWEMTQLRHINIWTFYLPYPQDDVIVLHNLQTLMNVQHLIFTEEVCKRIPNVKELCIEYKFDKKVETSPCYHLNNVSCFNKLVSLDYRCSGREHFGDSLQNLKFPSSLKELRLTGCKLVWSDMTMIASLPHLEFLQLQDDAVVGAEWNLVEEQFLCLKHLIIDDCDDLINWNIADSSNLPVLETLELSSLSELKEIPSEIGEIPTLESVYMAECSESATISAVGILEEQQSFGNYNLHLNLMFRNQSEAQMWSRKHKQLDSTCHNLHIF